MEAVYKLENDGVYEPQGRVKGGFFAGGVNATGSKLSMSQNFGRLREMSRDWLPSSKDPSHGWVINHVLNKLIDFQRMLYGHCNDNDDDDTVDSRLRQRLAFSLFASSMPTRPHPTHHDSPHPTQHK